MKRLLVLVVAGSLVGLCGPAAAALPPNPCTTGDYYYEILLDTDNNVSTGGPVTVVQGNETPHAIMGIDYIVRVWVGDSSFCEVAPSSPQCETAPGIAGSAHVHSRVVLHWNGSDFEIIGCGTTPYPVGVDDDGHALVEFDAPLDALGDPTWPVRGVFHASRLRAANDYTAAFLIGAGVPAPALSRWGTAITALLLCGGATVLLRRRAPRGLTSVLAGLLLLASGAWATAIVIDGQFADWIGIAPVVGDPVGDSSINDPAEDILRGFAVVQGSVVYFRMDLDGVPQPLQW